jgi:DNA-binding FadR family transcriptional regulator
MSIQPIKAPRLHERIAQEIVQLIEAGTFKPGSRLPAERQLAQSLTVSRSSLREALSALELQGVLEIRLGSGAYVRRRALGSASAEGHRGRTARRQHKDTASGLGVVEGELSPFDVLRARLVIEPEAAALAARYASPAQRAAIAHAFAQLELEMRANRPQPPADREFHVLIARASGNAALALVVELLWDQGQGPLGKRMESLYVTRGRKRDNVEEHRLILEAVVTGNPARARLAMRGHLQQAERQRMRALDERPASRHGPEVVRSKVRNGVGGA